MVSYGLRKGIGNLLYYNVVPDGWLFYMKLLENISDSFFIDF